MDGRAEAAMSDATRSIEEARAHLKECLASEKFLEGHGLGSQLPIFVAAIDPREDLKSAELSRWLVQQAALKGIRVTSFDLFEELTSSLKARGVLDELLAREEASLLPISKLTEAIRAASGLEEIIDVKIREIRSNLETRAVLFTGLGSVFPYFRMNDLISLLENAQVGVPAIVFFPGEFASTLRSPEMKLFSKIPEYYNYRAIDLFSYEP